MLPALQYPLLLTLAIVSIVYAWRAREGAWIAVYLWALILCEVVRWRLGVWMPEDEGWPQWLAHVHQGLYLGPNVLGLAALVAFEFGKGEE